MGTLTHLELVTEALQLAGHTGLSLRAQKWLGLILRELGLKVANPQRETAMGAMTLAVGDTSRTIGGASADIFSGVTITGVRKAFLQDPTNSSQTEMVLVTPMSGNMGQFPPVSSSLSNGRPVEGFLEPRVNGFTVTFRPKPDAAYRLTVVVDGRLPGVTAYSASEVAPYPNDLTIVQGLYALALKHMHDETAQAEWQEFKSMMRDDRVALGNMNPDNKRWNFASSAFRPKGAGTKKPWEWMGPQ